MATTSTRMDANKRHIMGVLSNNNISSNSSNNTELIEMRTKDHLDAFLQDAHEQFESQKETLATEAQKAKQVLKQTHVSGMLKLTKGVKKMTIREFNQHYKCNLLELFSGHAPAKKRFRTELETPAPKKMNVKNVPNTLTRTVQRGEALYSKNGSPVDTVDAGDLVATVTKKRRNNQNENGVVFDIAIGDGKYINLNDINAAADLSGEMKTTAMTQLKVLQNQMASLMAQLES